MAAPLGISNPLVLQRGDVPLSLLHHSTLSVVGERGAWMDGWLGAEGGAATKALEGILYSPASWEKAASLRVGWVAAGGCFWGG